MSRNMASSTRNCSLTFMVGGYAMLGPFSISTYMPFFPALIAAMGAS